MSDTTTPSEAPTIRWMTLREMTEAADRELTERRTNGWGPWHLDEPLGVLWTKAGGYRYEVDLERLTDAATFLDVIVQVSHKAWLGPDGVGWLVKALDDLCHLQGTVCGSGSMRGRVRWDVRERCCRVVRRQEGTPVPQGARAAKGERA